MILAVPQSRAIEVRAAEQPSGPEQRRAEKFHSRCVPAVGSHGGRVLPAVTLASPTILQSPPPMACTTSTTPVTVSGTPARARPFEQEKDARRKRRGIEEGPCS
jgi:hypothetical protein